MYCNSLDDCIAQIHAYANSQKTGYPLIVDTENFDDFQDVLQRLADDERKRRIYASEHTFENGLPDIQKVIGLISAEGCYVSVGLSQSLMLQSESELDRTIDELLGHPIKGHAIILLSHCRSYLEKYRQRDLRLEHRIVILEGKKSPLPRIRLVTDSGDASGYAVDHGIKSLVSHLERMTDGEIERKPDIVAAAPFSLGFFASSMYAVSAGGGAFEAMAERYPDFAGAVHESQGTGKQWVWLHSEMRASNSFSAYVASRYGSTSGLTMYLRNAWENGDAHDQWLIWLALQVFGAGANRYLGLVLSHSVTYSDLEEHIYLDILDVNTSDELFDQYYSERKQLIAGFPENLPQISAYCKLVGRHGENAAFYLTDATEDERFMFMQLLDQYDWTDDELLSVIEHGFPELSLYMQKFVFDAANTMLPEKDAEFRDVLTEYFQRYKSQKVRNHIDAEFLDEVNQFAVDRPFYKLQPRSGVLSTMDRKNTQGFFFDALGVEYLSYIQAKCEQYGLICDIKITHCELPSITSNNKDFKHYFDTKDIGDLDALKHHSKTYDYQTCPYPIYIFDELEIIDAELRKIRSQIIQHSIERAVIISDHGASRLAVIYQHEDGSSLQLDEKGEHSGRCCPAPEDPQIPAAAYEDGYAVLGNYERFKGGRKANLEVHGGASLEEVIVPIITISLRPDDVVYYFVDLVIKYKVGQPSEIVLFSNVPMKQPRLLVDGIFYDGIFQKDRNHALFTMKEPKRVRGYKASIYEGDLSTGFDLPFWIERNTRTKDLFGLS